MPINVRRVSVEDIKLKLLLTGEPGAGKTTMAVTANDHEMLGPALVLNFEGGLLSVAGRGDVDAIDISSLDELEEAFEEIADPSTDLAQTYQTIIVDSGSELYNRAIREATEASVAAAMKRSGGKSMRTLDDIEIGDYGKAGARTVRLFGWFRDLPKHVIVTAHPKFTYPQGADVNTGAPIDVRPAFSAKMAIQLMGMFDFCWYLYQYSEAETDPETEQTIEVPHRAILTTTQGAYRAKSRGPRFAQALGAIVTDPYLPDLYDLLRETESAEFETGTEDLADDNNAMDEMADMEEEVALA